MKRKINEELSFDYDDSPIDDLISDEEITSFSYNKNHNHKYNYKDKQKRKRKINIIKNSRKKNR